MMAISVVQQPISSSNLMTGIGDDFIIRLSAFSQRIPAWGTSLTLRDRLLREFFPTEPILCSALYSQASRYAAFGWTLTGGPRTADRVRKVLHASEHGKGWIHLIQKQLMDCWTQDNGTFMEFVRTDDSDMAPVVQINHLDSARCFRTGDWERPVVYTDLRGRQHEMKWYQVASIEEFPSANENMRGYQYSLLTRLLSAAQRIRDINKYMEEKISGRNLRAVHLVSGVSTKQVQTAFTEQQEMADAEGLTRYLQPLIIGSIDPTANVSAKTLELASLPDGFSEDIALRWYINQLALAFGADYQDFAPLPGGNLGSAHQSETLHLKSRGKGPALFMRMYEHLFNFHGVMPRTITFTFGEQDVALDSEKEKLKLLRANRMKILIESGVYTPEVAQQILMDEGELDEKYLVMLGSSNQTPETTLSSSTKGIGREQEIIRDERGMIFRVIEGNKVKQIERDPHTNKITRVIEL